MQLTRWEPFSNVWDEMNRLQDRMGRLFGPFGFTDRGQMELVDLYPPVDVWENADNLYAEAELPGLEMKDLEIYVTAGNQLTIKGERKPPARDQGTWHRQERAFGSFSRVLLLPVDVNADKVEARFHDGVLTITLPKSEAVKPKRIEVKSE